MFAAILTCGMAMVSCAVEDLPVDPADQPVVTVLDLEDEDALNAFVIADAAKMTASIVDDEATQSKALQLVRGGSSGIGFAAYQFPDMENATEVEISFDVNIKAAIQGTSGITIGDASVHNTTFGGFTAGQWGYGSNGAIFYFGGGRGRIVPGNNTNFDYFQINGVCKAAPDADAVKGVAEPTWDRFTTDVWNTWLTVNVVVNVAEKTYSYSIANGEEVYWAEENLPFVSEGAETCTQLDFHSGNAATVLFKNISVSKKKMDASIKYADYTIQFIDTEGNPIPEDLKVPVVRRGKVGTEITLLDSDKANMQTADGATKYIYQSDNSEGVTITEDGTVINVVFKAEAVPTYKYILNGMIDGVPGLDGRLFIFQGEEFVGKVTTFYLPIGCGKDGAYYFVTPKTYNGYDVSFNGSEETTAGYVLQTVNYVLDPNVVYFADCEDMEIVGETINGYAWGTFNRVSQGKHIRLAVGTSMTTKDAISVAGTYDIALYGRSDSGTSYPVTIYIIASDGTETKVEAAASPESFGNAGMGWFIFSNVAIPAGAKLKFVNETEGTGFGYDCLKVSKPAPAE